MIKKAKNIVFGKSLQSYFYSVLEEINNQIISPLPQEIIFYSSDVLDEYSDASKFDGKPLGITFLEASNLNKSSKIRKLKEVGDKSLLLSSFYSESINRKIVNKQYYMNLGKTAYKKLNSLTPDHYDVPSFYENLSNRFEILAALCLRLSLELNSNDENEYELKLAELDDKLSYLEKLITKIQKKSDMAA